MLTYRFLGHPLQHWVQSVLKRKNIDEMHDVRLPKKGFELLTPLLNPSWTQLFIFSTLLDSIV